MIDEGLAAFAWESDEGEKETLVADFSEAIQELRERFLAGYEVVRSGETYAHFQRALAGDAVKVALGQNAECLAQVRK